MRRLAWLTVGLLACGKAASPAAMDAGPPPAPAADAAPPPVRPHEVNGLLWYEDQPDAAFAAARASGRPIFLDLWAPWCPPCLQMKAFVLTRANLGELADQFVWLSIDVERADNVPFISQYPHQGLPTFYVINADHSVLARLLGSAPLGDVKALLGDALRARDTLRAGDLAPTDPIRGLVNADIAVAQGKLPEAAQAYRKALDDGGPGWPRRAATLAARGGLLNRIQQAPVCVQEIMPELASATPAASFTLGIALMSCAESLPAGDPQRKRAATAARDALVLLCRGEDLAALSADDRATACRWGWWAQEETGDKKGARASAERRLDHLARAVEGMPDEMAQADDKMLVETLSYLGRNQEAIDRMIAREKALPHSYNPPAHLADLYQDEKRWDDALAAIDRALALAYGPQTVAFLEQRAEILFDAGRKQEAIDQLAKAEAAFVSLPDGQKTRYREGKLAELRARIEGKKPAQ